MLDGLLTWEKKQSLELFFRFLIRAWRQHEDLKQIKISSELQLRFCLVVRVSTIWGGMQISVEGVLIFKHSRSGVDHNGGHKSGLSFFKKKKCQEGRSSNEWKKKKVGNTFNSADGWEMENGDSGTTQIPESFNSLGRKTTFSLNFGWAKGPKNDVVIDEQWVDSVNYLPCSRKRVIRFIGCVTVRSISNVLSSSLCCLCAIVVYDVDRSSNHKII